MTGSASGALRLREVAKIKRAGGGAAAYQYATIYAQWGDRGKALEWIDTAIRVCDPGLGSLQSDPLMDPPRKEPRFQAVTRELKISRASGSATG
jgi:hypothetical protein